MAIGLIHAWPDNERCHRSRFGTPITLSADWQHAELFRTEAAFYERPVAFHLSQAAAATSAIPVSFQSFRSALSMYQSADAV